MEAIDYSQLDPGIRDTVQRLREAGFETSDSGDGVSKPADQIEIPFPHVAAGVNPLTMLANSRAMQIILGVLWTVEATYFPKTGNAILLATREMFTPEEWAGARGEQS